MTPERIAELRARVDAQDKPGAVSDGCHNFYDVRELLDEVERGRGEVADLLARLDAAAFGANQVHARLEAAEKLAAAVEIIRNGLSKGDAIPPSAFANWRGVIRAALSAYRESTK